MWFKSFWTGIGAIAIYAVGVPLFFGCRERKKRVRIFFLFLFCSMIFFQGWLYATPPAPEKVVPSETDALINKE